MSSESPGWPVEQKHSTVQTVLVSEEAKGINQNVWMWKSGGLPGKLTENYISTGSKLDVLDQGWPVLPAEVSVESEQPDRQMLLRN